MTSHSRRPPADQESAAAPVIDLSDLPKPLTLRLDEPASISVRISGCPRPSVRWQVGRKRVKESAKYHMESDGDQLHVLAISRVTRHLEQGVWVVATNVFGEDCSLVEVRTLEIIFKQRKNKKEKHSFKRAVSLNSERSAALSVAHSTTSSLSARNRSIISLKDWKDEMEFRNKMRSVDDLVFTADKASLMSGFGYSLSADLGDSDDPDLIEQFHSLSKRSRRRPRLPPVPLRTSANLVFHELEPRRSDAPKRGSVVPERDTGPTRTRRLPEPVEDEVLEPDSEDFRKDSIDGKEEKSEKKKKKRTREKSNATMKKLLDRHANEEDDDDDDDGRGGRGGGEGNLFGDRFVSEEGSAWDLFGENLSNFCQNIFDKFSNLETKEEAESDKFVEIVDNSSQKPSKRDLILKPLPASDQPNVNIDKNPSLKGKSKVKKHVNRNKVPEETSTHVARNKVPVETSNEVKMEEILVDSLNVDNVESISEIQSTLSNAPENRKKRSKRRDILSKDIDKPEEIGEPSNLTNGSLICSEIDAGNTKEKRKSRQKASKVEIKLDEMADRDDKLCNRLEKKGSTKNPTRKKTGKKTKEATSNTKSNESNSQENKNKETDSERLLTTTAGEISTIQEDKEPSKTATVSESHENGSTPLTQALLEPKITRKKSKGTKVSSKTSTAKSKKEKEAVKTKLNEQMHLNSSYAVISGDGFIVDMQTEPKGTGNLSTAPTEKPVELTVPESIEILNTDPKAEFLTGGKSEKTYISKIKKTDFNTKSGRLTEFPTGENPENPVTDITAISKKKKRKKTANFRDNKTEIMVDVCDISETQFDGKNTSISCETVVPISDIIDYCDEPARRKPGSARTLSSSDGQRVSDLEQTDKNKQIDGGIGGEIPCKILQNSAENFLVSVETNSDVASSKFTETVFQQIDSNQALIERKDAAGSNAREKQTKKRVSKTQKPTSSQTFTPGLGSTVSHATLDTSSITGQAEILTSISAVPPGPRGSDAAPLGPGGSELDDQTLVRENFSILDADETSILKELAEKLKSGKIEIIIVNKDAESNKDQPNATQSQADDLSILSNSFGASVTNKLTHHERNKANLVNAGEMLKSPKGIVKEIGNTGEKNYKNINDSQLSAAGALNSDQTSENFDQILKGEPPMPKPRMLLLGRNSKIELKTENIEDDKITKVQTLSTPAEGRNVPELRDSAEFQSKTELENRNFHVDLHSSGLFNARIENESSGEVFEKSFQSRRKFFENQSRQHNVQKESIRSQPLLSDTVRPKSDSATQVSPKLETTGHSDLDSNYSSKDTVTSRSTGSQTDAVTSSPDDVIAKRASFSKKSELLKSDKDETSKVKGNSEQGVTANTTRTTQTTRQKPTKTYVPVFSNYYTGYGQVYRRGGKSYHVRSAGINGGPIEYLPDLLPALANPPRLMIWPKPTDSRCTEVQSLDREQTANKSSADSKKLVNEEPSLEEVNFTKTIETEETSQCSLLSSSVPSEVSQQRLALLTDLARSFSNEQKQCDKNEPCVINEETVGTSRHLPTEMKPEASDLLPTEMKSETEKEDASVHLPTEMKSEAIGHLPTEIKPEASGHLPTEIKPEAIGHLSTEMKPEASSHLPTEIKPEAIGHLPTEMKPETTKIEEFVTVAVSYEYGEIIKLLPAK